MVVIKKIVHYLSLITYLCTLVYALCQLPALFGWKPLVVLSGSMEPTYPEGSILYYKKVNKGNLRVGDVITFQTESGNFVSHRIHSIIDDLYETKGDANEVADPVKVSYQKIQGKDSDIYIPYIGYYIKFIGENLYLIIVAVIILIQEFLLSNLEAFDIDKKERRNNDGKKE